MQCKHPDTEFRSSVFFNDAVNRYGYVASVVNKSMNMEHW